MALKPVHALVGNDLFLQLEKLSELQRAGGKEAQRIDIDGETAQIGEVLDELRSFAMFSASKFVVVRNADELIKRFREQIEEYVQKPSAGSVLVLRVSSLPSNQRICKYIVANGQVHDCEAPKNLREWITSRAKSAHKLTIKPDAAALLLDLVGLDLGRLDNELAKLALQTGEVLGHGIEQARPLLQRRAALIQTASFAEQALEDDARMRFRRERGCRRRP